MSSPSSDRWLSLRASGRVSRSLDAVYHYHFKVNLRRLTDYPNLWGYARDLYSLPAFRDTTNFDHIKRHYYTTHPHINPARIAPDGPLLDWSAPHDRALS